MNHSFNSYEPKYNIIYNKENIIIGDFDNKLLKKEGALSYPSQPLFKLQVVLLKYTPDQSLSFKLPKAFGYSTEIGSLISHYNINYPNPQYNRQNLQ